jgi:ribosomal protein S11
MTKAAEFQALAPEERNNALRQLKGAGMSIRQISRMTGIPFGVVRQL